jgi:putative PIN family toxin of toxin-antitoxin system
MRVVADTNVLLSGLLWRGNSSEVLTQCEAGRGELWLSQPILNELSDVLRRPKPVRRLQELSMAPEELIEYLLDLCVLVAPLPLDQPVCRDPDDDVVLGTALRASADAVVTGDTDLLALQLFRGIQIITPASAAAQLRS